MPATIKIENQVALIQMDDGKANAINPKMIEALNNCLDTAEAEAKAVILTGRSGVFCGGFDLKIMTEASPEDKTALVKDGGNLICRLLQFPNPVIGALSGHSIAMGFFIALACDSRISIEGDYTHCANETAIGLSLPVFASELAKAKLPKSEIMNVVGFSKPYTPFEAQTSGLHNICVPANELITTSQVLAEKLTALPQDTFAFNKASIYGHIVEKIKNQRT